MTDKPTTPEPWERHSRAPKIRSLLLRGRYDDADTLIKGANADIARGIATSCKPAKGGPGGPPQADSNGEG